MNGHRPKAKKRTERKREVDRRSLPDRSTIQADPIQARIIQDLEQMRKEVRLVVSRTEVFSGPIPHPRSLAQYNDAVPNGGDRIMAEWETQGEHERAMDRMEHEMQFFSLRAEARFTERGQIIGLVIAASFLAASVWLIASGHDIAGSVLGTVDLVSLVFVFITGRNRREKSPSQVANHDAPGLPEG